jgi:hypothetical protein
LKKYGGVAVSIAVASFLACVALLPGGAPRLAARRDGYCVRPPDEMIAWWRGENNARDAISNHDGTLVGDAGFDHGKVKRAFRLDGNGDSISVPDHADWAFGLSDFTIDAWIYIAPSPSGDMTIVGQTTDSNNWWRFGLTSAGRLRFQAVVGGGAPQISVTSVPGDFAVERWHHVAVTRSQITTWAFYIDGVLLVPDSPANVGVVVLDGPVPDLSGPLSIGQSVIGLYFKGKLDEVEIFRQALTASQVQKIFGAGSAGKCVPDQGRRGKDDSDYSQSGR